jgi:hypothetical protein
MGRVEGAVAASAAATVSSSEMVGTGEHHPSIFGEVGIVPGLLGRGSGAPGIAASAGPAEASLPLECRRNGRQRLRRDRDGFTPAGFRGRIAAESPGAGIRLTAERTAILANRGGVSHGPGRSQAFLREPRRQVHRLAVAQAIRAQPRGSGTVATMERPSISALPLRTSMRT